MGRVSPFFREPREPPVYLFGVAAVFPYHGQDLPRFFSAQAVQLVQRVAPGFPQDALRAPADAPESEYPAGVVDYQVVYIPALFYRAL